MINDSNQIYQQILRLIQICDYDNSKELIEDYLNLDKDNLEILDLYAEVLVNLDLPDQAKTVLEKSIALGPDSNGDKYMSLAQLCECKKALKLYLKGIEIYKKQLENLKDNTNDLKASLANGYSAIAELYMNSSLWYKYKFI
jgi:tetratricopeptide (TPR) repeat protein